MVNTGMGLPPDRYRHILPESVLGRFSGQLMRNDILPLLEDPEIVDACFTQARAWIISQWDNLVPEAAVAIRTVIERQALWQFFDAERFILSTERLDFLRVRFDIADAIYAEEKQQASKRLITTASIHGLPQVRGPGPDLFGQFVSAYIVIVKLRSKIDMAIIGVQRVVPSELLIDRVVSRLRRETYEMLDFLRAVITNSIFFFVGDEWVEGLDYDKYDGLTRRIIRDEVVDTARPFTDELTRYATDRTAWSPSLGLLAKCKKALEDIAMPEDKDGMILNIHAPVSVINTGKYAQVSSISQLNQNLADEGYVPVRNAIEQLIERITAESALVAEAKTELLDQLELLRQQTLLPAEKRSRGVVRSVADSLSEGLKVAGSVADAWDVWSPVIRIFFGV